MVNDQDFIVRNIFMTAIVRENGVLTNIVEDFGRGFKFAKKKLVEPGMKS